MIIGCTTDRSLLKISAPKIVYLTFISCTTTDSTSYIQVQDDGLPGSVM